LITAGEELLADETEQDNEEETLEGNSDASEDTDGEFDDEKRGNEVSMW
jgi:hypothetical protein